MPTEEQIKNTSCPSCHVLPGEDCVDRSGVMVPNHVARRRRWKILMEDTSNTELPRF